MPVLILCDLCGTTLADHRHHGLWLCIPCLAEATANDSAGDETAPMPTEAKEPHAGGRADGLGVNRADENQER